MSCLSRVSLYTAAVFGRATHSVSTSASHQCSTPLWKRSFEQTGIKIINSEPVLPRFRIQCYSSTKGSVRASRKKESNLEPAVMEPEIEKDAFFVVRKGDVVGVYKSFADCQAQVGSSVWDPPVSVYKGYALPKDTKQYLVSRGLQNALYTIRAEDLKEDLFGTLLPCPFQQPTSSRGDSCVLDATTKKRSHQLVELQTVEADGSTSSLTDPLRKHVKLDNQSEAQQSCILEFDGASRGNPGPAGAGALLRTTDGSVICRLREGLGTVTCNVAEYRAVILGLKYALKKGYTKICVQGDSKLICSQIQGSWKVKHKDMAKLYEQVKKLKDKFISFQISHVLREFNSEADAQANLAVALAGEVACFNAYCI
ncbi:hypothetical protein JCGZ_07513 [Jatropha curcas]|uniref:RNase H type-1 domain-containing protein n=1 Tax=Jatropha curcas TaxID=180498 RepID=A0A067KCS3_JATCU|nr:hypothetical protein JCGZ_07513 [Jatropha curcas]